MNFIFSMIYAIYTTTDDHRNHYQIKPLNFSGKGSMQNTYQEFRYKSIQSLTNHEHDDHNNHFMKTNNMLISNTIVANDDR